MKPVDLDEYLGSFMWFRFCKQTKLDMFMHMLRCIGEMTPPNSSKLPDGVMQQCLDNGGGKDHADYRDEDFSI